MCRNTDQKLVSASTCGGSVSSDIVVITRTHWVSSQGFIFTILRSRLSVYVVKRTVVVLCDFINSRAVDFEIYLWSIFVVLHVLVRIEVASQAS